MAARGLASVTVSVTTLDAGLTRRLEPRASHPAKRLAAIRTLRDGSVPVSVLFAPVIPALNEWELDRVLEAAALAGVENAGYVLLRLPLEIKQLFTEWLEHNTPDTASHILSLIRQMRGVALYDAEFGTRMRGNGPLADLLRIRFKAACRRLGLNQRHTELDISQFCPPPATGDQLSML